MLLNCHFCSKKLDRVGQTDRQAADVSWPLASQPAGKEEMS